MNDHAHEANRNLSRRPKMVLFSRTVKKIAAIVFLDALILGLSLVLVVDDDTRDYTVDGDSMSPTLMSGQIVSVEATDSPRPFDIVLYRFPLDPKRRFLGRIIGVPGDLVAVREGSVWINRERLNESYIAEAIEYEVRPVVVRAGEYYILGDNRNDSYDSHV